MYKCTIAHGNIKLTLIYAYFDIFVIHLFWQIFDFFFPDFQGRILGALLICIWTYNVHTFVRQSIGKAVQQKYVRLQTRSSRSYITYLFWQIFDFSCFQGWILEQETSNLHINVLSYASLLERRCKQGVLFLRLKFIYSEKATKFCEISTLLLSYVVPVKSKVEILQNLVAFSEYMNFT